MNILHVNNMDLVGGRFNGHDMQRMLNKIGHTANQMVMERIGEDSHTVLLSSYNGDQYLRRRIMQCEKELSLHGMLYPYFFRLMDDSLFKGADLIHLHLLHNYFGSLAVLPELSRRKPSVLTIHDPWIFTGHCIYPLDCERWKTGCGECEFLNLNFPMDEDRTALQWQLKKSCFSKADLDFVVASPYMMELAKESPIIRYMERVHLIPFGIDIQCFSPTRGKNKARQRFGIPKENFVLCFRADPSAYKGFESIKKLLDRLDRKQSVTLLAVGNQGMLTKYSGQFQVVDCGWITDDDLMADAYCACDIFLMPSVAEAFGLMAIEAMAVGRPVICFEGTSLPSVTHAPECGIAVPKGDVNGLLAAVQRLRDNPEEAQKRGRLGREIAEREYRFEDYVQRHIELYQEILRRKR